VVVVEPGLGREVLGCPADVPILGEEDLDHLPDVRAAEHRRAAASRAIAEHDAVVGVHGHALLHVRSPAAVRCA
jgi:hypothetical protein